MKKVSTQYGLGEVLEESRGRLGATEYRVKGSGFEGWFSELEVFEVSASTVDEELELTFEEVSPEEGNQDFEDVLEEQDRDEKTSRLSAWADVRAKANRIRRGDRIEIMDAGPSFMLAQIQGDNGIYRTTVSRKGGGGKNNRGRDITPQRISDWTCTCGWGMTDHLRVNKYIHRMCSHALALYYEMQSQFGHNKDGIDEIMASRVASEDMGPEPLFPDDEDDDFESRTRTAVEEDEEGEEVCPDCGGQLDHADGTPFLYCPACSDMGEDLKTSDVSIEGVEVPHTRDDELVDAVYGDDDDFDDNEDDRDVVARFQASVGKSFLSEEGGSDGAFDFAAAAQAHLAKTSGALYSFEEQQALIDEEGSSPIVDELDLENTHYILP